MSENNSGNSQNSSSSSSGDAPPPVSDYGDLKEYGSQNHPKKPHGPQLPIIAKVFLMLCVVFLASIGYWKTQFKHDPEMQYDPLDEAAMTQRKPAPDVEFSTKAGSSSKLSEYKGKVVLLTFWAHWCEPCLVELPTFRQLSKQFADKGFVVVPVNLDTKGEADEFIANFWSNESLPFETYFDYEKKAAKEFNIDTLPANYIIDRQGRIVVSSYGFNDWTSQSSIDMIANLVAEKN